MAGHHTESWESFFFFGFFLIFLGGGEASDSRMCALWHADKGGSCLLSISDVEKKAELLVCFNIFVKACDNWK